MSAFVAVVAVVVGILALLLVATPIAKRREVAAMRAGTYADAHVFVEDDGSARDLTAQERAHLNGVYAFGDGARPYIKEKYASLTPDQRMSGYLPRKKLPRRVSVEPGR